MIFFTAVNDIKKGSKFYSSIVEPQNYKSDLIWGITELSKSTFEKINSEDYILFYHKFTIIGIGQVLKTKIDKNLSTVLFGTYEHKFKGILHWSNLLYLSKFYLTNIDFNYFIKIGEYSPKFSVRKLIGLNQLGNDKIIIKHNSYNIFIKEMIEKYGTQQCI
jgi:hypothetical protein